MSSHHPNPLPVPGSQARPQRGSGLGPAVLAGTAGGLPLAPRSPAAGTDTTATEPEPHWAAAIEAATD